MTPAELQEYRLTKALLLLSTTYNLGIGEVRARKLAENYFSIMDIALSSVTELSSIEGIGINMAKKILKALGREI